jgi:large subunit ribosomal protein L24
MRPRIKSGDVVMVIAGADKGKTGRVLRVLGDRDRVVVEGINRVWKHVRPNQRNPQGGRIQKDAPIHLSNVMPVDPKTGKATRVKFAANGDKKVRVAVKSGAELGAVGRK